MSQRQKRVDAITKINTILTELVDESTHEAARRRLLQIITQAAGYDFAFMVELEQDGIQMRVSSAYIPPDKLEILEKITGQSLLGYRYPIDLANVLTTPPIEVFEHFSDFYDSLPQEIGEEIDKAIGLKSIVSVRQRTKKNYLGAVNFFTTKPDPDIDLLETLCNNHLVYAIRLMREQSARAKQKEKYTTELEIRIDERTAELKKMLEKSQAAKEKISEYYIDLVQTREVLEEYIQEEENLFKGLYTLSASDSESEILENILVFLKKVFLYENSFIISSDDLGKMNSLASTTPVFDDTIWEPGLFFQRVLAGKTLAVYDTNLIPEWKVQNQSVRDHAISALHIPIISTTRTAILICCHPTRGFFNKKHIELAKRFSVLVLKALQDIGLYHQLELERDLLERKISERTADLEKINLELKTEISEKKQAEKEIIDLSKFPAENPAPVLRVSKTGEVLYANPSSEIHLPALDCTTGQLMQGGLFQRYLKESENLKQAVIEYTVGDQIYSFSFVPVANTDYINIYGRNITIEKEVDKTKAEFVANVSHELRTPLAAILGYAEILTNEEAEGLSEIQTEFLGFIHDSSIHLNRMVQDLLEVTKMESDRFDFKFKKINTKRFIQKAINYIRPIAAKKNITIKVELSPTMPNLYVDEERIEQVLINLLSNAVKFTPSGKTVTLKTSLKKDKFLIISIKDKGIGISQEDLPKLFDRFYRGKNAIKRKIEGTGLGLYISDSIIKGHNGKILVTSELGKGSQFDIILPLN